jgi:cytochrome c-type biogenesis protein CcmE
VKDPKRQRQLWYVIGGVLLIAFIAFGATSFKSNLTPYVSFGDAMSGHRQVQVAGELVRGSSSFVKGANELSFMIMNKQGEKMRVLYKGVKPGNFEDAKEIVVIGRYHDGAFYATQMLVKCPSKYQGLEKPGATSAS